MRTSLDVIHRALHDPRYEQSRVIIGFTDRLTKIGIREQPMTALNFQDDLAAIDDHVELALPQHRIEYIKYEGLLPDTVIWDKARRVDRCFGSTGHTTIVAELERMAAARADAEAAALYAALHADDVDDVGQRAPPPPATLPRPVATQTAQPTSEARPNAFLCLAVRDEKLREAAVAVQASLCEREPRLRSVLTPPNALHVTLAVTRLADVAAEYAAVGVLQLLAPRLLALVPPHSPLVLRGVRAFRDRVLYVAVEPHAGLHTFVGELRRALCGAGLSAGEPEEYTAHMTLCKLSRPLCRSMGSIGRDVWWGCSAVDFGEVA
eukprot:5092745-Prymnesium_polylepis.1